MSKNQIRAIAIGAALIVILAISGVRIAHPHSGVGTVIGSAKSSLVIYKKGHETGYKSKIVATVSDGTTALGVIAGTDTKQVYLSLGDRYETVKAEKIQGKLLAVLPFIGSIFSIFGR